MKCLSVLTLACHRKLGWHSPWCSHQPQMSLGLRPAPCGPDTRSSQIHFHGRQSLPF